MTERSGAIDPKPIISLMFGVSVGFWASELASFFTEGVRDTSATAATAPDAAEFIAPLSPAWWVLLCSGVLFLLDLLCIVWWYARYIYRVQPQASFWTYFLDFAISSMFALAANSWTNPGTFLFTTTFGTSFLGLRFFMLYRGPDASVTDRRILQRAGAMLALALLVAGVGVVDAHHRWPAAYLFYYGMPGALSLIGVVLTLCLRSMIDVAVDIYTAAHHGSEPTPLEWPRREPPNREQRNLIRRACTQGLDDFDNLFTKFGYFDKMRSRVHSDADVRIQAYILAVPSCIVEAGNNLDEITHKAAMTAVSHWLDDLVDGRSEIAIWRALKRVEEITFDNENRPERQFELFERLYRPLIIKHTGKGFYKQLCEDISVACPLSYNEPYMWLGLNRIAMGAVMFSPKIPREERVRMRARHNSILKRWNVEGDPLANKVEAIIDRMSVDNAGRVLLALTTKTVQEIAMASEKQRLNVSLSILYSILYAPLILYHNIGDELSSGEMVSLRQYDSDLETWVPWMQHVRDVIDEDRTDTRREARLNQAEMAFKCFAPLLPAAIEAALRPFYVTGTHPDRRVLNLIVTPDAKEPVHGGGGAQPKPAPRPSPHPSVS